MLARPPSVLHPLGAFSSTLLRASLAPLTLVLLSSCSLSVDDDPKGFDTPLDAAPDAPSRAELIINEVAPSGRPDDWFEVYNGTSEAISLQPYGYSDSADRPPVGFGRNVTLAPGEYYVEFLTDNHPGFGLGSEEAILLYHRTTLIDEMAWLESDGIEDGSLSRYPDIVGAPLVTTSPTPGFPNEADVP